MKYWIISALALTFVSCQSGNRRPSSVSGPLELSQEVQNVRDDLNNENKFNLHTCSNYIENIYKDVLSLSPSRFDYEDTQKNWLSIYNNLWNTRVQLHDKLQVFASQTTQNDPELVSCVNSMRDGIRMSRWFEDYLAETFSGVPQYFEAGNPDAKFPNDPNVKPLQGESPWLVINPKYKQVTIRSGDIIISRGNAYTSSAIARIGRVESQFSHLAFIYIEDGGRGHEYTIDEALKNPKVKVIEAHIEIGSVIRPLKDYFADGNARNELFRYKDALMAHRSAKWVYDYIQNYRKNSFDANPIYPYNDVNHDVPYNFSMDLSNPRNPKKLFCTQVAYVGFKNNNIDIPAYMSTMDTNLSLAKRMGITASHFFAPGDMELDPRFELIAEYRNLHKLKGLRMKDMVLSEMFKRMSEGYQIKPLIPIGLKSLLAWTLRQMDVKFTKPKLPKNMNIRVLNTTFTLEKIAKYYEQELQKEETLYQGKSKGLPLGYNQGLEVLSQVTDRDRDLYVNRKRDYIHDEFRPNNLRQVELVYGH